MKTGWKTTLLIALPLAGFLLSASTAEAHRYKHKHKRDHHCRSYKKHGWHDRGQYNDYYSRSRYGDYYDGRHGWYGNRGSSYDTNRYYPSRYPYDAYYNGAYYRDIPGWRNFNR